LNYKRDPKARKRAATAPRNRDTALHVPAIQVAGVPGYCCAVQLQDANEWMISELAMRSGFR
jgi:hypothetical protein